MVEVGKGWFTSFCCCYIFAHFIQSLLAVVRVALGTDRNWMMVERTRDLERMQAAS